jgi:ribosomal protein S18 acetylase RimI-like enzyme
MIANLDGGIEIRRARPDEDGRVAELIYGAPSDEAAGLAGGVEHAVALGAGLFLAGVGRTAGDDLFVVARDARAVGALLARPGGPAFPLSLGVVLRALWVIFRIYSLGELAGFVRRTRLRARLEFPVPHGSYHIIEIHVAPEHRGMGLGALLLAHAETVARERGCGRVNLTTALDNPARRLYSRQGYLEVARRTVPGYEELTGTQGRVFLEKALSGARTR